MNEVPVKTVLTEARPSRRGFTGLMLAGVALALTGCGRKPSHVIPAEDAGPDAIAYPRAYPDTRLDPPGTVPPSAAVIPPAPDTATPTTPTLAPPPSTAPKPAYPQIIRPEDLQPNGVLGSTGTFPTKP